MTAADQATIRLVKSGWVAAVLGLGWATAPAQAQLPPRPESCFAATNPDSQLRVCQVIAGRPGSYSEEIRTRAAIIAAKLLADKGDVDAALEQLSFQPQSAAILIATGDIVMAEDYADWAFFSYDDALELEPDNPAALAGRARASFALGEKANALADARRVLEIEPDNEIALRLIGDMAEQ